MTKISEYYKMLDTVLINFDLGNCTAIEAMLAIQYVSKCIIEECLK